MKKVLAIAPYAYLPYFSGGQKFIAGFFHYLGREVDLTVVGVPSNDKTLAKTYDLIPLLKSARSRYYDSSLANKLSSLIKEKGIDTIIWEHPYYAWLAKKIKARTGITSIIHTHNIEYQRFRSTGKWWWPLLRSYERKALRKADGIFFITPEDKQFAIDKWDINPAKCIDLPFGIDNNTEPLDRADCKRSIMTTHGIEPGNHILFFNGLLSYKPNIDAVKTIIEQIDPLLNQHSHFKYKILICGKDLPAEQEAAISRSKHIIYAGFTNEIDTYCKASDILLNPVLTGGGIKTKMVEAIGYGTTVVSSSSGATGIYKEVCGNKLITVNDNDWKSFATNVVANANRETHTPGSYYQFYYWENIIRHVLQSSKNFAGQPE